MNVANQPAAILADDDVTRVRRILYLNGLRGDQIDDAVQDLHVRILERPPTVFASARAWASAVATNLALDVHRRTRRRTSAERRLRAVAEPPIDDADHALKEAVRAGLAQLEPQLRAIVVLRFYANLSIPEIQSVLGIPEGTLKSRLHRGIRQLRALLPREGMTDD